MVTCLPEALTIPLEGRDTHIGIGKNTGLTTVPRWGHFPALGFVEYLALYKLLNLSESQFLVYLMRIIILS